MRKNITVNINITLKDKDMSDSEVFNSYLIWGVPFTKLDTGAIFKMCLGVLLEQDCADEEEIEEATRIIKELTNHEEGFNMTSKEA
jgi:hypothetical protein